MSLPFTSISTDTKNGDGGGPSPCVHPKRGRGKPTRYIAELCQTILRDIEEGVPKTKAFVGNGISLQTGYDWEKAHPEFAEAVKSAQESFRASLQHSRPGFGQNQRTLMTMPGKLTHREPTKKQHSQNQTKPSSAKATLTVVLPSKWLGAFAT